MLKKLVDVTRSGQIESSHFGIGVLVDSDGKILKELKKSEGVITVSIDPDLPKKLRSIIPSLKSN